MGSQQILGEPDMLVGKVVALTPGHAPVILQNMSICPAILCALPFQIPHRPQKRRFLLLYHPAAPMEPGGFAVFQILGNTQLDALLPAQPVEL